MYVRGIIRFLQGQQIYISVRICTPAVKLTQPLFSGYRGIFSLEQSGRILKLTVNFQSNVEFMNGKKSKVFPVPAM
jgi:hypothetical protein